MTCHDPTDEIQLYTDFIETLLHTLNAWDTRILLALNGNGNPFWDFVMVMLSNRSVWIPLYLWLIWILHRYYGKNSWMIALFAIAAVTISDQVSVNVFKNIFMRLRPCHEPSLEGIVNLVGGRCGGEYGFVSSHAANTFCAATFLFGFYFRKIPWLAWVLFTWAGIVSYSRIYLGVHYPGDVVAGMLTGIFIGWGLRKLCIMLFRNRITT